MEFIEFGSLVTQLRKQKKVLQILDYFGYEIDLKEKSPFPVFEDLLNGK